MLRPRVQQVIVVQLLSSVKKALQVLEQFGREEPELSLAHLSRRLGMHKSSVLRMLGTLQAAGFVEKDPGSGRYRLGLKILELAGRVTGRHGLRELAAPAMEELARRTGEIVHLAVLDGAQIVYLEKKGQGQVLTVATRIGGRNPAYASAMGKTLLAGLPAAELRRLLGRGPLPALTEHTISEVPALLEELERIRRQGFAVDDEETFLGIRCVAAPILGDEGKPLAAISVTVPKSRMDARRRQELRELVVAAAQSISRRCGGGAAEL